MDIIFLCENCKTKCTNPNGQKEHQQSQFLVAVFQGISQTLEPSRVASKFEDSDNSHDPKELSNPSDLSQIPSLGIGTDQGNAHIIP